jgi:hydroxylaminobenzene mutase
MARHARRLLQLGVVLLLLGLLTGLAIPSLAVPRLGLTSHIEGVLGGPLLVVLGLLWPRLRLGVRTSGLAAALAVYALFVGWLAPLLGAVWGAGNSMLPIAAGAARGTPLQEGVIAAGLVTAAVAIIVLCVVVLWGLRGPVEES